MDKSEHKNYVEWYWRSRDKIAENEILPSEKEIFNLFSIKFKYDSEKDLQKWRKILSSLWNDCANLFQQIHQSLKQNLQEDELSEDELSEDELEGAFDFVQKITDMDYKSINEFFQVLKSKYQNDKRIDDKMEKICENILHMRQISKEKTEIIQEKH